jgi:hypothetical protein
MSVATSAAPARPQLPALPGSLLLPRLTPALPLPPSCPQVAKDFTEDLAVYSSSRRSSSRLEQWSKRLPLSPIRRDSRS